MKTNSLEQDTSTGSQLIKIAEIFIISYHIAPEFVWSNLVALFPEAEHLDELVDFPLSTKYTKALLTFLQRADFLQTLNILAEQLDFNNQAHCARFFQNIHDLFELRQCRVNIPENYLLDYLAISNLLLNTEICENRFSQLEKELEVYARENNIELIQGEGRYYLPERAEKPFDRQKLLSGWLYDWARQNNFNASHSVKVTGFLSQGQFFSLISNALFFKDEGAPEEHGPWVHYLQWYIVIEENKKNRFLKNEPIALYKELGSNKYICNTNLFFDLKEAYQGRFIPNAAWDLFFDRLRWSEARSKVDYRIPEKITTTLCEDASRDCKERKWPLLSECISRTFKKCKSVDKVFYVTNEMPIIYRESANLKVNVENEEALAPDSIVVSDPATPSFS